MQAPLGSIGPQGEAVSTWQLLPGQADGMEEAYASLRLSVYQSLALQTRLRPLVDAVRLRLDDQGVHLDASGVQGLLGQRYTTDARAASHPARVTNDGEWDNDSLIGGAGMTLAGTEEDEGNNHYYHAVKEA